MKKAMVQIEFNRKRPVEPDEPADSDAEEDL